MANQEVKVLSIKGLTKKYGKLTAVDSLDLEVHEGSVFGLLGPNGSGKSTTLAMVLGVVNPTAGDFEWMGQGRSHAVRRRIGAIIESPAFYHYLSAHQNLKVVAKIKQVSVTAIELVLRRVGLYDRRDDKFRTFSLGMKQRLAIAAALLPDPKVMILDEPTNGLDPQGIAEIRELILELAKEGRTIIIASHMLDEVQRICTDFAVLKEGKKVFQGKVSDLNKGNRRVLIQSVKFEEKLAGFIGESKLVEEWTASPEGISLVMADNVDISTLHEAIVHEGIILNKLSLSENALERKFLEILKAPSA